MKVAAARELVQNTSDRPATGQSLLKYMVLVFRKGRTRECLTLIEVAGRNLIPCRSYYGWLRLTLGGRCSLSLIHTQSFPSSCKRFANENWPELACLRETFPDRRRKHRDGRRPGSKLANHRLAGEVFFPCLVSFHGLDFVAINLDSQNHIKAVLRMLGRMFITRKLEGECLFSGWSLDQEADKLKQSFLISNHLIETELSLLPLMAVHSSGSQSNIGLQPQAREVVDRICPPVLSNEARGKGRIARTRCRSRLSPLHLTGHRITLQLI
nr:hypothetical protein Iba_chr07cCG7230 [Ipomoea batatas]